MDAYTVQQYVTDWLNSGDVQGLDKVWPALPSRDGLLFDQFGGGDIRCQAVVYVTAAPEIRRGIGANRSPQDTPHGVKMITYEIRLEICQRSAAPDWNEADRALKQDVVEGILAMIRLDSALGTGTYANPLFQAAGEGPKGIRVQYEPPFAPDDVWAQREQWALVEFTALGWVMA